MFGRLECGLDSLRKLERCASDFSPKLQAAARWIADLRAEPVIGRRYAPTRWRIPE